MYLKCAACAVFHASGVSYLKAVMINVFIPGSELGGGEEAF